jgi:hypothetical protein
MGQFFRLVYIGLTVLRFGLDEVALSRFRQGWVRALVRVATIGRRASWTRRAAPGCAWRWRSWGRSS